MILILVRFVMCTQELAHFMDLPALVCTSYLHKPHQNKNHSLIKSKKLNKTWLDTLTFYRQTFSWGMGADGVAYHLM